MTNACALVGSLALLLLMGYMDKQDTDHERFYYCKQVQAGRVHASTREHVECTDTLKELRGLPEAQ